MKYHILAAIVVSAGALTAPTTHGQDRPANDTETTRTWLDHSGVQNRLKQLAAAHRGHATLETIGKSIDGRQITAMRVAMPGEVDPDERPAILLVAGIDADHLHGTDVAIDVTSTLLERAGDGDEEAQAFLESNTLYVVPRVNPDGTELMLTQAIGHAVPGNSNSDDADRDRSLNEDGPDDLNGDGMITMMRVYDVRKGDMIADPDEERLQRKPDREEGERPAFYMLTEGHDNDGDGRINEDGTDGVDLNMNFMHGYKAHADGAGRHPLSEPESLALLQYTLEHQNIAAIIVFGRHDTLSSPPSESGRNKAGAPNGIDSGDEAMYARISDRFVDITELERVQQPDWSGSFVAWGYAQYGVPAFSTPLWTMPAIEEAEVEENDEQDDEATAPDRNRPDAPEGRGGPRGSGGFGGGGGFDREAMMDEFDTDGDGEISEDERDALREAMRERFGGRGGGGGRGGPRGGAGDSSGDQAGSGRPGRGGGQAGGRGGRGSGRGGGGNTGGGSGLTPSGIGDISQETMDELKEWAIEQGYPVEENEDRMSELTPEMVEMFAKQAGIEIRRVSTESGGAPSRRGGRGELSETDWLVYSDTVRNGEGFVEWTEVEHPDFDRVEVGGWAPMFRTVPPTSELDAISEHQVDFILDLAEHLPKVTLEDIEVKRLAEGLWEIKASLVNEGRLPAGTAMARRNRRARPWVVRLGVPPDRILSGRPVHKVWTIDPDGGRYEMRWIVEQPDHEPITVELFSEKYGSGEQSIQLSADEPDGGAM